MSDLANETQIIKTSDIVKHTKYKMPGGIHPEEYKTLSNQSPIRILSKANQLTIALSNSSHLNGELQVKIGEVICKGQTLFASSEESMTNNTHSPCNGKVLSIDKLNTGHPSGLPLAAIRIEQAIKQNSDTEKQRSHQNNQQNESWVNISPQDIINRIHRAGIVGLGGAAFPTHIKLKTSLGKVGTLIVNAMECEPYITCDDKLLQEKSSEILQGALITAKAVGAIKILFGIEDNKPEAINCLKKSISNLIDSNLNNHDNKNYTLPKIEIVIAKTKYPSGGEKQLIQLLTGLEVPQGKYPAELGMLVQNVATLYAINQAINHNENLTQRLVTITGDSVPQPGNYWIQFGTPIFHIIESLKIDCHNISHAVFGGPLMGNAISDFNVPTQKSTNCIIFDSNKKLINNNREASHSACIRCGECEFVCPVSLLPQQLFWFSQSEQWEQLEKQDLFDCIECGACTYVCPSKIPLVGYYRYAKSEIKYLNTKHKKSELAKKRFENRENRLARIKAEREEKRKKTAEARKLAAQNKEQDPDGKKSAIQAALDRVKNKKEEQS